MTRILNPKFHTLCVCHCRFDHPCPQHALDWLEGDSRGVKTSRVIVVFHGGRQSDWTDMLLGCKLNVPLAVQPAGGCSQAVDTYV
jgi:hypothetical protein